MLNTTSAVQIKKMTNGESILRIGPIWYGTFEDGSHDPMVSVSGIFTFSNKQLIQTQSLRTESAISFASSTPPVDTMQIEIIIHKDRFASHVQRLAALTMVMPAIPVMSPVIAMYTAPAAHNRELYRAHGFDLTGHEGHDSTEGYAKLAKAYASVPINMIVTNFRLESIDKHPDDVRILIQLTRIITANSYGQKQLYVKTMAGAQAQQDYLSQLERCGTDTPQTDAFASMLGVNVEPTRNLFLKIDEFLDASNPYKIALADNPENFSLKAWRDDYRTPMASGPLSTYFNAFSTSTFDAPVIPDIVTTDDIGECVPLILMLRAIMGGANDLQAEFPFITFQPYTPIRDEACTITFDYKDVGSAASDEYTQYQKFFQLYERYGDVDTLLKQCDVTKTTVGAALKALREDTIALLNTEPYASSGGRSVAMQFRSGMIDTAFSAAIETGKTTIIIENKDELIPTTGDYEKRAIVAPVDLRKDEPLFVTCKYGERTIDGVKEFHHGIDLRNDVNESIVAPERLVIVKAFYDGIVGGEPWDGSHIKAIGLDSGLGFGFSHTQPSGNLWQFVLTTDEIQQLTNGTMKTPPATKIIEAGTIIGTTNKTGRTYGAHLHMYVYTRGYDSWSFDAWSKSTGKGWVNVNPIYYLKDLNPIGRVDLSDERITTVTTKAITQINPAKDALADFSKLIFNRISSKIVRHLENNVKRHVTGISVNWRPGTSAPIMLQGEQAPVIQSMGGRTVDASITLDGLTVEEVAGLVILFKATNREDNIMSMMLMVRQMKCTSGNRNSLQLIHSYYTQKQFEDTMTGLTNTSMAPKLEAPITITNETLNALGLEKFSARNIQVTSHAGTPGKFKVILDVTYLNVAHRRDETLVQKKTSRMFNLMLPAVRYLGTPHVSDATLQTFSTALMRSFNLGLADLLALYTISRVRDFVTNVNAWSAPKAAGEAIIDLNDPETGRILMSMLSTNNTLATAALPEVYTSFFEARYNSKWMPMVDIVGTVLEGVAIVGSFLATRKVGKGQAKDQAETMLKSVKQKSTPFLAHAGVGCGATALAMGAGVAMAYNSTKAAEPNILHLNLLPMMLLHAYDLMREYIEASRVGKTDDFIKEIATKAIDLLTSGTTMPETGGNPDNLRYLLVPVSKAVLLKNIPAEDGTTDIGFGYVQIGFDWSAIKSSMTVATSGVASEALSHAMEASREMSNEAQNCGKKGTSAHFTNTIAAATLNVELAVMTAIEQMMLIDTSINNVMQSKASFRIMSNFEVLARRLLIHKESREFADEICMGLISASGLDTAAFTFLKGYAKETGLSKGTTETYTPKQSPITTIRLSPSGLKVWEHCRGSFIYEQFVTEATYTPGNDEDLDTRITGFGTAYHAYAETNFTDAATLASLTSMQKEDAEAAAEYTRVSVYPYLSEYKYLANEQYYSVILPSTGSTYSHQLHGTYDGIRSNRPFGANGAVTPAPGLKVLILDHKTTRSKEAWRLDFRQLYMYAYALVMKYHIDPACISMVLIYPRQKTYYTEAFNAERMREIAQTTDTAFRDIETTLAAFIADGHTFKQVTRNAGDACIFCDFRKKTKCEMFQTSFSMSTYAKDQGTNISAAFTPINDGVLTKDIAQYCDYHDSALAAAYDTVFANALVAMRDRHIDPGEPAVIRGLLADRALFTDASNRAISDGICLAMQCLLGAMSLAVAPTQEMRKAVKEGKTGAVLVEHDITYCIHKLFPTVTEAIVDMLIDVTFTFAQIIVEGLLWISAQSAIVAVLTAAFGEIAAIAVVVVMWAVILYQIADVLIKMLLEEGMTKVFINGGMFRIGEWLYANAMNAMTPEHITSLCLIAETYMPSLLTFHMDAYDDTMTSYMDYPLVRYRGKPMSVDLYMYKIGMLQASYDAMMDTLDTMISVASENLKDVDSTSFDQLYNAYRDMSSKMRDDLLQNYEMQLSSVINGRLAMLPKGPYQRGTNKTARSIIIDALAEFGTVLNKACGAKDVVSSETINGTTITVMSSNQQNRSSKYLLHLKITIPASDREDLKISIEDQANLSADKQSIELVTTLRKKEDSIFKSIQSQVYEWRDARYDAHLKDIISAMFQAMEQVIFNFFKDYIPYGTEIAASAGNTMPGTLGNIMFLRNVVGSSMHNVGRPGVVLYQHLMEASGVDTLRRTAAFRAGYMFPTIKLYFIEEDNEAFYLFDDLYAYSSVVDASVHKNDDSPLQTCTLRVTNFYHSLDNTMADAQARENFFFMGADEQSSINATMLKPGCKIKLQAGSTPILTEINTLFTGRITNIQYGDIVTITAESDGNVMETMLSEGAVRVYRGETKLEARANSDEHMQSKIEQVKFAIKQLAFDKTKSATTQIFRQFSTLWTSDSERKEQCDVKLSIVSRLRNIIGEVLADVTYNSHLDDYTINADIRETEDPAFNTTAAVDYSIAKKKLIDKLTGTVETVTGIDFDLYYNRQLMENVNIYDNNLDSTYAGIVGGFEKFKDFITPKRWVDGWVTFNESAWQILREMNLLLPNYQLSVRPFDVRSTLVWGHEDSYYRYRRSGSFSSLVSTSGYNAVNNAMRRGESGMDMILNKVINTLSDDGTTAVSDSTRRNAGISMFMWLIKDAAAMTSLFFSHTKMTGQNLGWSILELRFNCTAAEALRPYTSVLTDKGMTIDDFMLPMDDGMSVLDQMGLINRAIFWCDLIPECGMPTDTMFAVNKKDKYLSSSYTGGRQSTDGANAVLAIAKQLRERCGDYIKNYNNSIFAYMSDDSDSFLKSIMEMPLGNIIGSEVQSSLYPSVKMICLEYAAQNIVAYLNTLFGSRSSVHKKLSDLHMKSSGIDIVSNDIQLVAPYNVVNLTLPRADIDPDMADAAELVTPQTEQTPSMYPVHYTLKPWAYKPYAFYFKNANLLSFARSAVVSTMVSSVASELLSNTYAGSLTLLGDPQIVPGDKMFINDYNRDMFGVVRVKSHTFKISAQGGCLSIIEPKMVVKSQGKLQQSAVEIGLGMLSWMIGAAAVVGSVYLAKRYGKSALRSANRKMIANPEGSGTMLHRFLGKISASKFSTLFNPTVSKSGTVKRLGYLSEKFKKFLSGFSTKAQIQETITKADAVIRANPTMYRTIANAHVQFMDELLSHQPGTTLGKITKTIEKKIKAMPEIAALEKENPDMIAALFSEDALLRSSASIMGDAVRAVSAKAGGIVSGKTLATSGTTTVADNLAADIAKQYMAELTTFISSSTYNTVSHHLGNDTAKLAAFEKQLAAILKGISEKKVADGVASSIKTHIKTMNTSIENIASTAKGDEKVAEMVRQIIINDVEHQSLGSKSFWEDAIKAAFKIGGAISTVMFADWLADSGKAMAEGYLTMERTKDMLTIAPLWFRGEPFLAGLDGMTKKDAEEAGISDVLKARFDGFIEGISHAGDSYRDLYYQSQLEYLKTRQAIAASRIPE